MATTHRRWVGSTSTAPGGGGGGGWVDTFVLEETEPIGGVNVGAGVLEGRPLPTVTADAKPGVTYSSSSRTFTVAPGVTVEDVVFPGFVNLGDGSQVRNYLVNGPASEVANTRALVQGPSTSGRGILEFGTIDPDVASAYYDGFGRGITARRTWVRNVTDGVRAFSTSTSGARIRGEGVLIERLAQFAPDYVNSRAETHNDVVQFQGNPYGDDTDIFFAGCKFDARHSLTKGDVPPYRKEIAAIMFTPQTSQGAAHGTFTGGWLLGGVFCVNAGSDAALMASSSLVITNTRFERPGTDAFGDGRAPTTALAVDSSLPFTGSGNTYIDNGAPVPVTNA